MSDGRRKGRQEEMSAEGGFIPFSLGGSFSQAMTDFTQPGQSAGSSDGDLL
jgi:hypothetical protein